MVRTVYLFVCHAVVLLLCSTSTFLTPLSAQDRVQALKHQRPFSFSDFSTFLIFFSSGFTGLLQLLLCSMKPSILSLLPLSLYTRLIKFYKEQGFQLKFILFILQETYKKHKTCTDLTDLHCYYSALCSPQPPLYACILHEYIPLLTCKYIKACKHAL